MSTHSSCPSHDDACQLISLHSLVPFVPVFLLCRVGSFLLPRTLLPSPLTHTYIIHFIYLFYQKELVLECIDQSQSTHRKCRRRRSIGDRFGYHRDGDCLWGQCGGIAGSQIGTAFLPNDVDRCAIRTGSQFTQSITEHDRYECHGL